METLTLYKLNNSNEISWWVIVLDCSTIHISWGSNLPITESLNQITYPFDTPELAEKDFNRRVSKQMDRRGYTLDIPTTQPDLPMLAVDFDWNNFPDWEEFSLQPKLDGVRAIGKDGKLWSRTNEEYMSAPHINMFINSLPRNIKLDGELIIPNTPLEDISGIARRKTWGPMCALLEYHVYDIIDTEKPFHERSKLAEQYINGFKEYHIRLIRDDHPYIRREFFPGRSPVKMVETIIYSEKPSNNVLREYFDDCLGRGYEGCMLRDSMAPYEIDKRSKSLRKVKPFTDAEFTIVEISTDKRGRAILHMEDSNGTGFESVFVGTDSEQRQIAKNPWLFKGKLATVKSEGYYKDTGRPRGPKVTRIFDSPFEGRKAATLTTPYKSGNEA